MSAIDVLIPTADRPAALAVLLTSLVHQTFRDFRVIVSDQSQTLVAEESGEVAAVTRLLHVHGIEVAFHRHLPRRGMAEQRQFLLDRSRAALILYLDDDLILEPWVIEKMHRAMTGQQIGFVGSAVIGLSHAGDVRPHEETIELWNGPVEPERVLPGSRAWDRYRLHNAANVFHLQRRMALTERDLKLYKVAWVGGCVLYDAAKLRASGGFSFWQLLPDDHCGEDVLAQLRVMSRFGGCGILPSGVYHQEVPTTVRRRVDAPRILGITPGSEARVSVIMPVFERHAFIRRALASLHAQTTDDWELIIVDDGSALPIESAISDYLIDPRIRLFRFDQHHGLSAALNFALDRARADRIAYLPSDDVYFADHLETLLHVLEQQGAAVAVSGVIHHGDLVAPGPIPGHARQFVQVMHRAGEARWPAAVDASDDLDAHFWDHLGEPRAVVATGSVSCEWVDHPDRRHRLFGCTIGHEAGLADEVNAGSPVFDTGGAPSPQRPDGLTILVAGNPGRHADRLLTLRDRGHRVVSIGSEEMPAAALRATLAEFRPDVIYALLGRESVPLAHALLKARGDIPFVWHFGGSPLDSIRSGSWPQLADLHTESDAQIYCTREQRDWTETAIPDVSRDRLSVIMEGDLPRSERFVGKLAARPMRGEGEVHIAAVAGEIDDDAIERLAAEEIHIHIYGEKSRSGGRLLHAHPLPDPKEWVTELSRHDAAWLYGRASSNRGEIRRARSHELTLPASLPMFAAACLPMIVRENGSARVAVEREARERGIALLFSDIPALATDLRRPELLAAIRQRVWSARDDFTFERHAGRLVALFTQAIARAHSADARRWPHTLAPQAQTRSDDARPIPLSPEGCSRAARLPGGN